MRVLGFAFPPSAFRIWQRASSLLLTTSISSGVSLTMYHSAGAIPLPLKYFFWARVGTFPCFIYAPFQLLISCLHSRYHLHSRQQLWQCFFLSGKSHCRALPFRSYCLISFIPFVHSAFIRACDRFTPRLWSCIKRKGLMPSALSYIHIAHHFYNALFINPSKNSCCVDKNIYSPAQSVISP